MDKKTKNYLIIGVVIVGFYLLFTNLHSFYSIMAVRNPLNIINVMPEKQPENTKECLALNGRCIPLESMQLAGYINYGYCNENFRCVIEDMCEKTGGKFQYKLEKFGDSTFFAKKCICPEPLRFSSINGCYQGYG